MHRVRGYREVKPDGVYFFAGFAAMGGATSSSRPMKLFGLSVGVVCGLVAASMDVHARRSRADAARF
jgi:hypothetical protein